MHQDPPTLALHSTIVELLPDPVLLFDLSGALLDANPAAARLLAAGYTLAGKELLDSLQRQVVRAPATRELTLAGDGVAVPCTCIATPWSAANGTPVGTLLQLHALPVVEQAAIPSQPRSPEDSPTLREAEEALLKIGVAITSGIEMTSVLRAILDECRQVLPVDTLYVALYDRSAGTFQGVLFWDQGTYRTTAPVLLRSHPSLTAAVIDRSATLYLPDLSDPVTAAAHPALKIADAPTRSWLGTPLLVHGEVIGVLSIQHLAPDRYTPDHIRLLEMIATQAAVAVENARLYELAQQKLAERHQMAQRLALATEVANIGVWDWERADDQLIWDAQMWVLHGVAADTPMTFATWQALIYPEDLPGTLEAVQATIAGGTHANAEYRVVLPDGSLRYLRGAGGVLRDAQGEVVRQIGVCRDITDRKDMEEALRASEQRYRLLVDNAHDVIWAVDLHGRFTFVSPSVEHQLGYTPAELIGIAFDR